MMAIEFRTIGIDIHAMMRAVGIRNRMPPKTSSQACCFGVILLKKMSTRTCSSYLSAYPAPSRNAAAGANQARELTIRLGYLLGRLFALAIVVVLVRQQEGKDAGLTALLVIVFAFTVQLLVSIPTRPRSR